MFSDPLVALMVMLLLCFIGMLVMFLFVIRSLATQNLLLREGFRRHEAVLSDLEKQIMDINFTFRQGQGKLAQETAEPPTPPAPPPVEEDLRSLFEHVDPTDAFGQRPGERSAGPNTLFSASKAILSEAYPSAAGLPPLEDNASRLSRDADESETRSAKAGTKQAAGLNLRLDG